MQTEKKKTITDHIVAWSSGLDVEVEVEKWANFEVKVEV